MPGACTLGTVVDLSALLPAGWRAEVGRRTTPLCHGGCRQCTSIAATGRTSRPATERGRVPGRRLRRSEPEPFIHQDHGDAAGDDRLVDDKEIIYSAGHPVSLPGPQVLKRKAVLVDSSQSSA